VVSTTTNSLPNLLYYDMYKRLEFWMTRDYMPFDSLPSQHGAHFSIPVRSPGNVQNTLQN
jgi:hypothetical protein